MQQIQLQRNTVDTAATVGTWSCGNWTDTTATNDTAVDTTNNNTTATQQRLLIAQQLRERRATGARRGPTGRLDRAAPVNGNTNNANLILSQ